MTFGWNIAIEKEKHVIDMTCFFMDLLGGWIDVA
jgi:hypothetical protein